MDILKLLTFAVHSRASDLHLSAGLAPMIRLSGDLQKINLPVIEHKELMNLLYEVMDDKQRTALNTHMETDFSLEIDTLSRFRVNVFRQSRGVAAVFRVIPTSILSLDQLGFPNIFKEIASFPHGLVLVTGATGSGKSTTLAALIDYINSTRHQHILTIEDPIEFIHQSKKCLINQREIHRDSLSFKAALCSALREDPNVIMIGELRDLETIRLAMTAAETGHLVFATLHTNSATKAINRIIDVFPAEEKAMVRSLLSESLQAVVAQTLLPKVTGGRVAGLEIMLCTRAIRHLIREDKVAQMYSVIQTGQAKGMQTLDQHLTELLNSNVIARPTAYEVAINKELF